MIESVMVKILYFFIFASIMVKILKKFVYEEKASTLERQKFTKMDCVMGEKWYQCWNIM
jgi:hypothetical protein